MTFVLAILVGGLFASGLYLMMRRSAVKLILGFALLSHATNLVVFTAAGVERRRPPLVAEEAVEAARAVEALPPADPLPQALILTAIVISFGVLAFTLVLVHRAYQTVGTDDLDRIESTER